MSAWDTYQARLEVNGTTRRERALKHTQSYISKKITDSLSCHKVLINGIEQTVTILNQREDMALKKICALPGEQLLHGGIVDFADSKWLITELDANDEVYTSGMMQRCNYLLKWLNKKGEIIEKWCIVEDGTKYLIGEKAEDMMSIGDARIAITICKDSDTIELGRGKRFLVDDLDAEAPLAYQITKPNKLFNVYDGQGVFRFILNEVNMTDDDNVELRIADYFNWKPDVQLDNEHQDADMTLEEIIDSATSKTEQDDNKEVWL